MSVSNLRDRKVTGKVAAATLHYINIRARCIQVHATLNLSTRN